MHIKKEVENRHNEILNALERIERNSANLPDGNLLIKQKKKPTFYHEHIDKDGNKTSTYLSKSDIKLIRALATKGYLKKLKRIVESEEKALARFIKDYNPEQKYDLYDNMNESRKDLVTPVFASVEEKVKEWRDETYASNDFHSEGLKVENSKGEMMRSKSEVIIANIISEYKDLEYRYEKPLEVMGGVSTLYPDFTIMNTKTGKIYYLEHIGMLEVSEYAESFIKKMNTYTKNGLRLGVDVLCTFESRTSGIDIAATRRTIEYML